MAIEPASPHLPRPAQIEAYGNGGFRFGGMSHRGSILCTPKGIWAWPVSRPDEIDASTLKLVLDMADELDFALLGTGREMWRPPAPLRNYFHAAGMSLDFMPTGAAARTYNVLLAEGRRVAAGLVAVD